MQESEVKILYSDVQSQEVVEAEPAEVPIVDFSESKVEILYQPPPNGLDYRPTVISGIIGLSVSFIYKELDRKNVPTKAETANPEREQRRIEGIRQAFSERHDDIVAEIQSPQARINRGEGVRSFWAQNTTRVSLYKEQIRSAGNARRERKKKTLRELKG